MRKRSAGVPPALAKRRQDGRGLQPLLVVLALAMLAVAGAVWAGAYVGQPALSQSEAGCWHPTSDKAYMENWVFYARTDDGGFLYSVFMVSNMGLYNFNPGFSISYYAPDGKVTANEFRIDNDRFHAATDRFDVKIGDARYWREGKNLRLAINDGKILADLTLTPTAAPWTAGTGRLPIGGAKESWNWIMPAPRGTVHGTVTVEGKIVNLQGRGYSDHYWSNKAYFTFSRNWLSFHMAGPKWSVNYHQLVRTKKYGGDTARSLMMVADGEPAHETSDVEFEPLEWTDGQKFRQPKAFTLRGAIDGAQVTIEARNGRYGEIIDPIGSCSKIEQKIVRLLVADPMVYRLVMDAKITVAKDGRVEEEQGHAIAAMLYFEQ